jgi:hypothetical protein
MKSIRNLIVLALAGTFLWKFFQRRESNRQVVVESPETLVVEEKPKHSVASDLAGASVDTAKTAGSASAKAARTGASGVSAGVAWARSRMRKDQH